MQVFTVLPTLKIKDGWKLCAYEFIEGGNGNGFVWALENDKPFSEPADCWIGGHSLWDPPKPPDALTDFMDAIEGDGSPESYISSSILQRELKEFGAMWHGCSWSTHEIIRQEPLCRERQVSHRKIVIQPYDWEWLKDKPASWEPCVKLFNNKMVEVNFYSYSGLGRDRIFKHVDLYNNGNYTFSTDVVVIAKGQGGYLF